MDDMQHKGYRGTARLEDGAFFGQVADLKDVITFRGATLEEARLAFEESVDDYLAFCAERGRTPELPS